MLSGGLLGPQPQRLYAVHPGRVCGPNLHTVGVSWIGKIPVVERENGDAVRCTIVLHLVDERGMIAI